VDVVERALEQRMQCGVAGGLGEGREDHNRSTLNISKVEKFHN
jgi:hypothetical protein